MVPIVSSPLHIHFGQSKGDPLEQQNHEEALAEGAVPDALPIIARLGRQEQRLVS